MRNTMVGLGNCGNEDDTGLEGCDFLCQAWKFRQWHKRKTVLVVVWRMETRYREAGSCCVKPKERP
jgi:hypothetical protein